MGDAIVPFVETFFISDRLCPGCNNLSTNDLYHGFCMTFFKGLSTEINSKLKEFDSKTFLTPSERAAKSDCEKAFETQHTS